MDYEQLQLLNRKFMSIPEEIGGYPYEFFERMKYLGQMKDLTDREAHVIALTINTHFRHNRRDIQTLGDMSVQEIADLRRELLRVEHSSYEKLSQSLNEHDMHQFDMALVEEISRMDDEIPLICFKELYTPIDMDSREKYPEMVDVFHVDESKEMFHLLIPENQAYCKAVSSLIESGLAIVDERAITYSGEAIIVPIKNGKELLAALDACEPPIDSSSVRNLLENRYSSKGIEQVNIEKSRLTQRELKAYEEYNYERSSKKLTTTQKRTIDKINKIRSTPDSGPDLD